MTDAARLWEIAPLQRLAQHDFTAQGMTEIILRRTDPAKGQCAGSIGLTCSPIYSGNGALSVSGDA